VLATLVPEAEQDWPSRFESRQLLDHASAQAATATPSPLRMETSGLSETLGGLGQRGQVGLETAPGMAFPTARRDWRGRGGRGRRGASRARPPPPLVARRARARGPGPAAHAGAADHRNQAHAAANNGRRSRVTPPRLTATSHRASAVTNSGSLNSTQNCPRKCFLGLVIFAALLWLTARRGATNPVCGMKVDRAEALTTEFAGRDPLLLLDGLPARLRDSRGHVRRRHPFRKSFTRAPGPCRQRRWRWLRAVDVGGRGPWPP
jgi:hypothetical protein